MSRYPLAVAMSRMADQVGRVLSGRYRLIAPIGTGSSAQVYLADDVRLRRRVAVKVLHAALADDDQFLRRFRAEAQAAAALNHPHILAVYDWGEHDGTPYLVTEYLAGGSVRAILDRGARLTLSQALLVGLEATRALDAAHRRGFVHRDIKPANLLFGDEGRLRIADFGLARALAEAAWTEPQGAVLGTARYASPEQAQGQSVTGKADIYGLALVIIESVTGSVPFTADTTIGTLMARVDRDLEVPDAMGVLAKPLSRAGQADPEARPDARGLAAALMASAADLPRPQPLPLVPTAPGGAGNGSMRDDGDDTLHAALPGTIVLPAGMTAEEALDLAATSPISAADETVGDTADDAAGDASDPWAATSASVSVFDDDLAPAPPRRRRWPIVLAAVVLAALIGGGAAWGWTESQPPEHEIPNLVGTTETEARELVDDFGWKIDIEKTRKDGTEAGRVVETHARLRWRAGRGRTLPPRRVRRLDAGAGAHRPRRQTCSRGAGRHREGAVRATAERGVQRGGRGRQGHLHAGRAAGRAAQAHTHRIRRLQGTRAAHDPGRPRRRSGRPGCCCARAAGTGPTGCRGVQRRGRGWRRDRHPSRRGRVGCPRRHRRRRRVQGP